MSCTADKSVSLLIYATIALSKQVLGTIGCNANHINAVPQPPRPNRVLSHAFRTARGPRSGCRRGLGTACLASYPSRFPPGNDAPIAKGWFHLDVDESRLGEHCGYFLTRILFSFRPQQHDDAARRHWKRPRLLVVIEHLMDHEATTERQRREALLGQQPALLRRPIVINHRIEVEIRCREGVLPHIPHLRVDTTLQAVAGNKLCGYFTYGRSIEDHGVQIWPASRRTDAMRARAPADVKQEPVAGEIQRIRPRQRSSHAGTVHGAREGARQLGLLGMG